MGETGKTKSKRGGLLQRATDRIVTLVLVASMTIGIALLVYPSFADYWNSFHQSRAVMSYAKDISNLDTHVYDEISESAKLYNEKLGERGISWILTEEEKKAYNAELNIGGTGIMGYIRIQKLGVTLPIYHGTDDSILQTSIGHLEASSLPVGGSGTHCMLSGHRGLPSARLFTDLDKMKEGDQFTLNVLNETLTYEVDHIWIVEPADLSQLTIEPGKDYCTLITCTPYGINTHRLLVRGHRVENVNGNAMIVAEALQIRPIFIAPIVAVPIVILLLLWILVDTSAKRKKNRNIKEDYLAERGLTAEDIEPEERRAIIDAVREFMEKGRNR